ncbi:hypothetical protein CPB83DRAFT_756586 [Crepidotus variabilis]|uniref:Amidohydrolase-related domain-containing protein n=1 Tax=Crepidotus variabilis TaxID=179855 RepID=A0A9P6EQK4_9AGAR|nr:hypothetical protein CPB83DRAFT_756586 [Crepidotus variabilis]
MKLISDRKSNSNTPLTTKPSPKLSPSLSPAAILAHSSIKRIDVHHHYFPSDLKKSKANSKIGWKTPEGNLPWSPSTSLAAMDAMSIDLSILSFPPIPSGSIGKIDRASARSRNEYAAQICRDHLFPVPRFGFFATLPFLDDVEGCLEEIRYTFDQLGAFGVSIASCYGEGKSAKYVGHETYLPIWAELNRRKAVVFLHGAQVPSSTPYPHEFLGIPVTESPNETLKAAAHLVVTQNRRIYPNVKIILAHLGGTTPFLACRVAVLSNHMGCALTPEEILEDFKTFYYETALSAYETNLLAIDSFVEHDHVLFGTDFPAVSRDMSNWYTNNLEMHYANDKIKLQRIMRDNAVKLFTETTNNPLSEEDTPEKEQKGDHDNY